jgi:Arc/MetJ-type ribon-helix-helix transcriptional regulator
MNKEQLSEKVSVNVNAASLSAIDLLIDHGFYSNRSDFINQAIRDALQKQQTTVDRLIEQTTKDHSSRTEWFLGVFCLTQDTLAAWSRHAGKEKLCGYGLLIIDKDCDEELLFSTVKSISIHGSVRASASVKEYYGIK